MLPNELTHAGTPYKLEKIEVPVEYEAVDVIVEQIWSRKPKLVIHCGVNGSATCINIEKLAYNYHFTRPDYTGKHLAEATACLKKSCHKQKALFCKLNLDKIVQVISDSCGCKPNVTSTLQSDSVSEEEEQQAINSNSDTNELSALPANAVKLSKNVGSYLCGYIYLKSLDYDCMRSLFIHVPPVDKPFSSETTAKAVLKIVEECLRQVVERENE